MMRARIRLLLLTASIALAGSPAVAEFELDPATGLKMTGEWKVVRNNCIACHSAKLITQQRGTAKQWLDMIRWMQEKQNLWDLDAATEAAIVSYLAENYAPSEKRRRAAIPHDLMPPNPYARSIDPEQD